MKDQRNILQKLQEGIKRTWKHIAIPVTIAVFSVIGQPAKAQENGNLPDNLKFMEALVDTINVKPMETYFIKMVAENKRDSTEITSMFDDLKKLESNQKRPITKMIKMVYESEIKDYERCIMLAIILDPEQKTELGKDARKRVQSDPFLHNALISWTGIIENILKLEEIMIEDEKLDEEIKKLNEELAAYKKMVKLLQEMKQNFEKNE